MIRNGQEGYDRQRALNFLELIEDRRRKKDFDIYIVRWSFMFVVYIVYALLLSVLYIIEYDKQWGAALNTFVLTEIILKITTHWLRVAVLITGRYYTWWMRIYKFAFRPISMGIIFFWNFFMLIIFAISADNWDKKTNTLFVASVIMFVFCAISLLVCWSYFIFVVCDYLIAPFEPQAQRTNTRQKENEERVKKITKELKNLKANNNDYTPNEDNCWICMEAMGTEDIVNLPWHRQHWMHFQCISEWLTVHLNWPMWKEGITLDKIKNEVKSRERELSQSNNNLSEFSPGLNNVSRTTYHENNSAVHTHRRFQIIEESKSNSSMIVDKNRTETHHGLL